MFYLQNKLLTGRWLNQENTNEGQKFKTANKENKNPREKVTHNRVAETQQTDKDNKEDPDLNTQGRLTNAR